MPQTIQKTDEGQIIAGAFSSREDANQAVQAFKDMNILQKNIQIFGPPPNLKNSEDAYSRLLAENGFTETQTHYYNKMIGEGKILVVVYEVSDPNPIIDIFDEYKAEYNPNGNRNLRDDVVGMTVGAVVGAAAGGFAGSMIAGPVGTAAGAAVGAVVGGGSGAAAGIAVEHRK